MYPLHLGASTIYSTLLFQPLLSEPFLAGVWIRDAAQALRREQP